MNETSVFFTGMILAQIAGIAFFIWRAIGRFRVPWYHLVLWFLTIYILEYELYLEIQRFLGNVVTLTDLKVLGLRLEGYLIGMFLGDVINYVEKFNEDKKHY